MKRTRMIVGVACILSLLISMMMPYNSIQAEDVKEPTSNQIDQENSQETQNPTPEPQKKTEPEESSKVKIKNKVKKITFDEHQISLRLGEKVKLSATVMPKNATVKKLQYKSCNEKYVTVTEKGVVRAQKVAVGKRVKILAYSTDGTKVKDRVQIVVLPKINPNKKMVALTFDDGPNYKSTPTILNTLQANGGVATFFIIGECLGNSANRKVLKRSYQMGNEIGNHTTHHKNLTSLSAGGIYGEISKADKLIKKVTGEYPTVIRPPYGSVNRRVGRAVDRPLILWSIDTLDWQTLNPSSTYRSVMGSVRDGSVVLMHDMYTQSAKAATRIIPALKKKGYQFVTISELYKYKGKKMKQGGIYGGIR